MTDASRRRGAGRGCVRAVSRSVTAGSDTRRRRARIGGRDDGVGMRLRRGDRADADAAGACDDQPGNQDNGVRLRWADADESRAKRRARRRANKAFLMIAPPLGSRAACAIASSVVGSLRALACPPSEHSDRVDTPC